MISRQLSNKIKYLSEKMPVVAVTGPRQSGKTTLVQTLFPQKPYISLEDLDTRAFATNDPRAFLEQFPEGAVLDEVQHVPSLFSYIQTRVDADKKVGQFILTGSQNFNLLENISQSLAGRTALLTLLPLSLAELKASHQAPKNLEAMLFEGFYPRLYKNHVAPSDWFPSYIQTYVERDVRMIKNIQDLTVFQHFIRMCAARVGQLLDLSSLANDCGITHNTAKSWVSLLETSFIVFRLQPHFKNFNKRLVKSPKLYFYDTGLLCSLLGIEDKTQLTTHYLKGGIFETFVISELLKLRFNQGKLPNAYFWRDKAGREIDCILEFADQLIPIEIKSGKTIADDFFSNLHYWNQLSGNDAKHSYLIYGGDQNQKRSSANVLSWKNMDEIEFSSA